MKYNDPSGHNANDAAVHDGGGGSWYSYWGWLYDNDISRLGPEFQAWLMDHQNMNEVMAFRTQLDANHTGTFGAGVVMEFDAAFRVALNGGDLPGLSGDPIAQALAQGDLAKIPLAGWGLEGGLAQGNSAGIGGKGGCNSFNAKTIISTNAGEQPIVKVKVGDQVLAWNEATDEIGDYSVTATHLHLDHTLVYLTIDGETILTTPEHPFFTESGHWVGVSELRVGSRVKQIDGDLGTVHKVEVVQQPQMMYNLSVAEANTFVVGDGQWLVHNQPPCKRFNGPKPRYTINPAHQSNPNKTPIPADAEAAYANAVPGDPQNPRTWWSLNADGQIYRYSSDNAGGAHFSGIVGVGDGARNITPYAKQRLGLE